MWDGESGQIIKSLFRDKEHGATSIVLTEDASYIITTHLFDSSLRIWEAERGRLVALGRGHKAKVLCVSISSDRKRLVLGLDDATAHIYSTADWHRLSVFRGHEGKVTAVSFSPDGQRIFSGSSDNTLRMWDADSTKHLAMPISVGVPSRIVVSPSGNRIASMSSDKIFSVWNVENQEVTVCSHGSTVTDVTFSNNGQNIVSSASDDTMRVWDVDTGECLELIHGRGDIKTIIGNCSDLPFRAVAHEAETVIELASNGGPIAWLPAAPEYLITHPSGRIWAGPNRDYMHFFHLESGD